MPGDEFFARMAPEFAQHAGSARESASRQGDLERLIASAEYECYQLRRELVGVIAGIAAAAPGEGNGEARTAGAEAVEAIVHSDASSPARAA